MSRRCVCFALSLMAAGSSWAAEPVIAAAARIEAKDVQSLQDGLLGLTQERLQPMRLLADPQHARLSLSGVLPTGTHIYRVRSTWRADGQTPLLPLTFELRPDVGGSAIQATLAVPLLREVWVATRRLRKGSAVTCVDLRLQHRPIRHVPKAPLSLPCAIERESVALRDLAPGDVMRDADIGRAPDVTAGAPVRVHVATGVVSVTATALALTDARVGDRVDVRLQRSSRTLRARVTGPGRVEPI